jgi:hypothetical protein
MPPSLVDMSRELFDHLDADKSNTLEWAEFVQFATAANWTGQYAQHTWAVADRDGSGSIDRMEFMTFCSRCVDTIVFLYHTLPSVKNREQTEATADLGAAADLIFTFLDKDRSQSLSWREFTEFCKAAKWSGTFAKEAWRRADVDNSGDIDRAEFQRFGMQCPDVITFLFNTLPEHAKTASTTTTTMSVTAASNIEQYTTRSDKDLVAGSAADRQLAKAESQKLQDIEVANTRPDYDKMKFQSAAMCAEGAGATEMNINPETGEYFDDGIAQTATVAVMGMTEGGEANHFDMDGAVNKHDSELIQQLQWAQENGTPEQIAEAQAAVAQNGMAPKGQQMVDIRASQCFAPGGAASDDPADKPPPPPPKNFDLGDTDTKAKDDESSRCC